MQYVDRLSVLRLLNLEPRISLNHRQSRIVFGQLEPSAAGNNDLRVDLNRRGAHAKLLIAKLGKRRSPQAKLHRTQLGHGQRFKKQQPRHHALHVFEFDLIRLVDQHRALHPQRAQVQVAHIAVV